MNCIQARRDILVADLAVLALRGESALSTHLATCDECRRRAAAVVDGTAALSRAVARRRASRGRIAVLAAVPIAAGIIGIIAMSKRESQPPRPMTATSFAAPLRHVSVDVAPGQRAAVLRTADPNVTLIWLSPGVGQ